MAATNSHARAPFADATPSQSRRSFVRLCATGAGVAAAVTDRVIAAKSRAIQGTDAFAGYVAIFAGTFVPRGRAF